MALDREQMRGALIERATRTSSLTGLGRWMDGQQGRDEAPSPSCAAREVGAFRERAASEWTPVNGVGNSAAALCHWKIREDGKTS